jgi:cellulose biosynthesis protein BcsQ
MSKLQLYVLDDDMAYAERLAIFIRATECAERVQVKLFSQVELLLQVLEDPNIRGVLLLSEAYYPVLQHHRTSLYKMFLSENITNSIATETVLPFLFRFQPLHQLLTRIQALYTEGIPCDPRPSDANRTRVLSVYSSSGNSGKSITAVHMAKQLAFRGKSVLYLSLETVSAASQWLQGESGRLSQLLYYLKVSPESIGPKLELLKSHDATRRFDYLTPYEQMREMQEMSGDHVKQLIAAIVDLSVYDTLIVDLEASVHPRIIKSLELSDDIIWLVRDDWNDAFKTHSLYKQMSAYPHVHFVLTSYRGSQSNSFEFLGKNMTFKLPYIPEWKVMRSSEQVWQSDIFSEQVYGMLKAVFNENVESPKEGAGSYFESRAI